MDKFEGELRALINRYSVENRSDTPDFILASYVSDALAAFERATIAREKWYGRQRIPAPPPGDTTEA